MEKIDPKQPPQTKARGDFNVDDMNQVRQLVDSLSTDEKSEVSTILRSCAGEMTLKRGVPMAILITGIMHYTRDKLPTNLQKGPRKWLFTGMLASGAVSC